MNVGAVSAAQVFGSALLRDISPESAETFSLGLDQLLRHIQLGFELADPSPQPGQLGLRPVRGRPARLTVTETLQPTLVALFAPLADQRRVQALPPADLRHRRLTRLLGRLDLVQDVQLGRRGRASARGVGTPAATA